MKTIFTILLCVINIEVNAKIRAWNICYGSDVIKGNFEKYTKLGIFTVYVEKSLDAGTNLTFQFSSNVVAFTDEIFGKLIPLDDNTVYKLTLLVPTSYLPVTIQRLRYNGNYMHAHVRSVLINGEENCPISTFEPYRLSEIGENESKQSCGRRKVKHNQLIAFGNLAKAGDWPWHVAISKSSRYICGGSLISDRHVLTAGHCVTKQDFPISPESLSITLGKSDLMAGDESSQEIKVVEIIVHDNFTHRILDNDIAILKLSSAVTFNDYIQPICLWFDRENKTALLGDIIGSVVGWGIDQTGMLSPNLRTATLPLVPDLTCFRKKPHFYGSFLNGKRFCAGFLNGTSACNGDSGGGYVVFIPSNYNEENKSPGVWFIRGIISLAFSKDNDYNVCDPNEYVIFTDVDKYAYWIKTNIK